MRGPTFRGDGRTIGWDSEPLAVTLQKSYHTPRDAQIAAAASYSSRVQLVYPRDAATIVPTATRRLHKWSLIAVSEGAISTALTLLRRLPATTGFLALRTWLNGWTTSRRTAQENRSGTCGCTNARDDQLHYLTCVALWAVMCSSEPGLALLGDRDLRHRLLLDERDWDSCKLATACLTIAHKVTMASCAGLNPRDVARNARRRSAACLDLR